VASTAHRIMASIMKEKWHGENEASAKMAAAAAKIKYQRNMAA